ncbi:MAG: hypothetical protein NTY07_14090 [Bacteroidia bacterium]|nr:hypothetical protein [Bacteroidia bacterium]
MKKTDENIENWFGNLKKGQPFRVPESYFETFADRLKVRIEEEEQPNKKRSLFIYLKPILMMAASFVLVMLLVSVPIKKFFPSGKGYIAQRQLNTDSIDSASLIPATLISYFSEGQFLSAVSDVKELESDTLSTDNLADYIAANYSEYDIIANN